MNSRNAQRVLKAGLCLCAAGLLKRHGTHIGFLPVFFRGNLTSGAASAALMVILLKRERAQVTGDHCMATRARSQR